MEIKFAAYSAYQDTGIAWLPRIPAGWRIQPLFSVLREEHIKNDNSKKYKMLSLSYGKIICRDSDNNIGLLPRDFNNYQLVFRHDILLRLIDLQNDKQSLRVGYATQAGVMTSAYLKLVCAETLCPRYAYLLLHLYDQMKIFYGMGGGLRQMISFKDLRRLPFILPPLEEQHRIARFLDHHLQKIDDLLELQNQLITLLEEKRQATITHTITQGLNPRAKRKAAGIVWLDKIPAHWRVTRLKYACSHIVDCLHSTPDYKPDGEYPAIRTADIHCGYLNTHQAKRVSHETYLQRNARLIPRAGDILYAREGERFGVAACIPEEEKVCLGQRVLLLRARQHPQFLMWALNASTTYAQALQDVNCSTSPHINIETIKNFVLPLPPAREQAAIAAAIERQMEKINKLIALTRQQRDLLLERRFALIASAVSGQIKIDAQTLEAMLHQPARKAGKRAAARLTERVRRTSTVPCQENA